MINKVIFFILLFTTVLNAQIFQQSSMNFGVSIGASSVVTNNSSTDYATIGLDFDYYILDGLSVGVGYRGWLGASPSINQVSMPVTYFMPFHNRYRPYIGAFIRETFVFNGNEDYTSYGGRAGISVIISSNSYMGMGWVVEDSSYCSNYANDCSLSIPEFFYGVSF